MWDLGVVLGGSGDDEEDDLSDSPDVEYGAGVARGPLTVLLLSQISVGAEVSVYLCVMIRQPSRQELFNLLTLTCSQRRHSTLVLRSLGKWY